MPVVVTTVPANKPILVEGQGEVTFVGGGEVSYAPCQLTDAILPITMTAITHHPSAITHQPSPNSFNLQGQRVGTDYRGFVIRSGKKYLNR